jgi:hypothetical protein
MPCGHARWLTVSPIPHAVLGKPRLGLKEEAGMLTSKERAVRASGVLKSPILAELACFADLYGSDLVLKRSPNPDQNGITRKVAERSPSTPSGFANLMFPPR